MRSFTGTIVPLSGREQRVRKKRRSVVELVIGLSLLALLGLLTEALWFVINAIAAVVWS